MGKHGLFHQIIFYGLFVTGELNPGALVTADVISKMDKLFDVLNSDSADLRRGKPFSTNLGEKTQQIEFLKNMLLFFKNIHFVGTRAKVDLSKMAGCGP